MSTHNFEDLTGQEYGRLTAIRRSESKNGRTYWLCRCECGKEKEIYASSLKRGLTKSCGCFKKENSPNINLTHGMTSKNKRSPEYITWMNMIQRCTNHKSTGYADYGGRGITVSERWFDFENFFEDMGKRPTLNHSIERIEVDGNYEPYNCKWATAKEQSRNRRLVNNKTGYRGVYQHKKKGTWQASIRVGGKNISLGYFKNPEEAAKARLDGELKYWGKSS